jgi:hypothetical protein
MWVRPVSSTPERSPDMSDETQRAQENVEKAENKNKTATPADRKQDEIADEKS